MNNTHKYNLVFKTKISDSGEIKLKKDISRTDIECEKCGMASCHELYNSDIFIGLIKRNIAKNYPTSIVFKVRKEGFLSVIEVPLSL